MRPAGARRDRNWFGCVPDSLSFDRPPFTVESVGPGDPLGEVLPGDELTRDSIQYIKESVLRRLHDDLSKASVDAYVGENHRLRGREVPHVARRLLKIPNHLPCVRLNRDDGGKEQVVAAAGTAIVPIPRTTVAGSDVKNVSVGIVRHGIPSCPAAAQFPPLARPRLGGHRKLRMFERLGWVPRHGVKPPD